MLVLPTDPFSSLPESLQFNNSFGLPSLRMPRAAARAALRRIADLSAPFGTRIAILEIVGGQEVHMSDDGTDGDGDAGDDTEVNSAMRAEVFGRVKLDWLESAEHHEGAGLTDEHERETKEPPARTPRIPVA
jgi:hypothetical protein